MPIAEPPAQVSLRRIYPVAPEKVWRAWTDPQALSRWFGPGEASLTRADIDLREGGRYHLAFAGPDGGLNQMTGVYQEVRPFTRLVFTWAWHSTPERVSRVSIDLAPVAAGTELRFVHDRFFDEQARINHERGWAFFFSSLDRFLQEV
ncbi:SRPBCC domain-containing protein [Rugamonas sp. FT107W]|uniref:SRPBCC domain-containing protein n=1 Tax=Duganella vulcania TaxID=2692166 RepID=A0A845HP45_9BURK|nr:SRPBCC domain-containing protein [Duganella vulcania]MYN20551.1 SRPBCC domain-containing protein [Duganella vulcania]